MTVPDRKEEPKGSFLRKSRRGKEEPKGSFLLPNDDWEVRVLKGAIAKF
jgi:hypothetical protein